MFTCLQDLDVLEDVADKSSLHFSSRWQWKETRQIYGASTFLYLLSWRDCSESLKWGTDSFPWWLLWMSSWPQFCVFAMWRLSSINSCFPSTCNHSVGSAMPDRCMNIQKGAPQQQHLQKDGGETFFHFSQPPQGSKQLSHFLSHSQPSLTLNLDCIWRLFKDLISLTACVCRRRMRKVKIVNKNSVLRKQVTIWFSMRWILVWRLPFPSWMMMTQLI